MSDPKQCPAETRSGRYRCQHDEGHRGSHYVGEHHWTDKEVTLEARVAELEVDLRKLGTRIVRDLPDAEWKRTKDHGCAECVPGGPLVIDGFRCAIHVALATTDSVSNGHTTNRVRSTDIPLTPARPISFDDEDNEDDEIDPRAAGVIGLIQMATAIRARCSSEAKPCKMCGTLRSCASCQRERRPNEAKADLTDLTPDGYVRSTTVEEWECIYCGAPFKGRYPSVPGICPKRTGTAANHCFNPTVLSVGNPTDNAISGWTVEDSRREGHYRMQGRADERALIIAWLLGPAQESGIFRSCNVLAEDLKLGRDLKDSIHGPDPGLGYPKSDTHACIQCPKCSCTTGEGQGDFPCSAGGEHEWQTIVGVTLTCSCGDENYHRCPDALVRHLAHRTNAPKTHWVDRAYLKEQPTTKDCPECDKGFIDVDEGRGGTNIAPCYRCRATGRVPCSDSAKSGGSDG